MKKGPLSTSIYYLLILAAPNLTRIFLKNGAIKGSHLFFRSKFLSQSWRILKPFLSNLLFLKTVNQNMTSEFYNNVNHIVTRIPIRKNKWLFIVHTFISKYVPIQWFFLQFIKQWTRLIELFRICFKCQT